MENRLTKISFRIGSESYGSAANFSGLIFETDYFRPVLIESSTFFFPVTSSSLAFKKLDR